MALSSFIVEGGERMQVIVRSASPGAAIAAAQQYRVWLLEQKLWETRARPLEVIDAG